MKNSTFPLLLVLFLGSAANAQRFTVTPMIGREKPITKVSYNDLPYFEPLECQTSRTLGARMAYNVTKGFAPFIGVSTTQPTVSYSFANPETGTNAYTATAGKTQLQLQTGLQAKTKPIYFKKAAKTKSVPVSEAQPAYRSCGSYKGMGHCGARNKPTANSAPKNKGWFVSIVPSLGIAFNPFTPNDMTSEVQGSQTTYTYNAGNSKTALLTGLGFEFGNNTRRLFTVNINYYKGLGNNDETITTEAGVKPVTTSLSSKVSGVTASVGIPISFGKKGTASKTEKSKTEKSKCEFRQYKSSCRRVI